MSRRVRLLGDREYEPVLSPAGRPVRELIRAAPLVCEPSTTVQDAARRMVDAGVTCAVVDLGDQLGIVTDRDIRERVVAAGSAPDTPLSEVMSAPAWTVAGDRTGTEALLEMLDHGVRHLPVLDAGRRLIGVLDDVDLMASERRAPFRLRSDIARSPNAAAVARAASGLPETMIALHDADLPIAAISRAIASVHDSATRRLIDLAHADLGPPPVPYTWLATGSFGRLSRSRAPTWTAPSPGTAPTTTPSCAAGCTNSPSTSSRICRRAARGRREGRGRVEPAVRPLDRGLGVGGPHLGRAPRSRPGPDAALRCRGERSRLGHHNGRGAPVRGVRPQPQPRTAAATVGAGGAGRSTPDGLPEPPGAPLERRAEDARHQEGGAAADRGTGALERPGRWCGRGHDARTDRSVGVGRNAVGEDAAVLRDVFELVASCGWSTRWTSCAKARRPTT